VFVVIAIVVVERRHVGVGAGQMVAAIGVIVASVAALGDARAAA
jgi:hypothetical protein